LKERIVLEEERLLNTYDTDYGDDDRQPWDVIKYCTNIRFEVVSITDFELEFDLINVEAPFANALRRILLAEVPSMAIEKVFLFQNTSLIQDEVLADRLGLIPIKADPREFVERNLALEPPDQIVEGREDNTLQFELKVKCTRNPQIAKESTTDPDDLFLNHKVFSKDLKWIPFGEQAVRFHHDPPRPVHPDILLAKLRPGQEIELQCRVIKGIGRDHAKFSPVATASYRLLPEIILKEEITGEEAERLKDSFSNGVIGLVDRGDGVQKAVVKDARRDMCSRNVFRYPDLAKKVLMTRHKRHFIFSVESTGAVTSADLVMEACQVMQQKCRVMLSELARF